MDERFMSKVSLCPLSGCWVWTGPKRAGGYGMFDICSTPSKHCYIVEHSSAHRYSYELFVGPIPDGLYVCHKCDVRACVNPEHLFLGTPKENTADAVAKGRHKPGLKKGRLHPRAKLREGDAEYIRMLLNLGAAPRDLRAAYDIGNTTLFRIRHRSESHM